MNPNLNEEKRLWKKGIGHVAGLDEAGRGPLAGPVVAAAVVITDKTFTKIPGVKNSKELSEREREKLYEILTHHNGIQWGVGIVSEKVIDKINILEATKLAMEKALADIDADFLLIDGNFTLYKEVPQKTIIKGDEKVFSIAAASILAKVTRDRLMQKYHNKYPDYGFAKHKGYGTAFHVAQLKKIGPCKIHRKTFAPVSHFYQ
jgi:ribonuclease HII